MTGHAYQDIGWMSRTPAVKIMRRELWSFVLIGALATALQYAVLLVAVALWSLPPTLASSLGFLVSLFFNYALNRKFTFRSSRCHSEAFPRFLIVSLCGLMINGAVLALAMRLLGLPLLAAQVLATVVVLGWNFLAHRAWTFTSGLVSSQQAR